ncbi:hypothetical protein EJB05_32567, partial [Eragrostis curvula]
MDVADAAGWAYNTTSPSKIFRWQGGAAAPAGPHVAPPVVPHIAGEAFRLTEWYTVPKGATVFPSLYESSFQGFQDPEAFDPDRFFSEARREDVSCKRNFLAFGSSAHQCVGQRYALNHLVLFMALFVSLVDFRRDKTKGCDELVYIPTIAPKDGCAVFLKQRCTKLPSF